MLTHISESSYKENQLILYGDDDIVINTFYLKDVSLNIYKLS